VGGRDRVVIEDSGKIWVARLNLTSEKSMTSDSLQLCELLVKAGANDIVRVMIACVTQRFMELDVDNHCGASHDERAKLQ
jgi:hypothetical protein